jgi:hypothetical protein
MTLPEVGASQFLQPPTSGVHTRKPLSAIHSEEEGDTTKGHRERQVSSSTQDQVTLSKEAQTRANSTSQASTNHSFQQSPSPFDR